MNGIRSKCVQLLLAHGAPVKLKNKVKITEQGYINHAKYSVGDEMTAGEKIKSEAQGKNNKGKGKRKKRGVQNLKHVAGGEVWGSCPQFLTKHGNLYAWAPKISFIFIFYCQNRKFFPLGFFLGGGQKNFNILYKKK